MDSATKGVMFFSLGSNVKISHFPNETDQAIIRTFSNLPLKVLWKSETDNFENLPPNVKIEKWLPQGDILAHPNTKLFVSHGGLLSTTEAVYHGVPVVGIPIFGDQEANVAVGVNDGYIVKVPFNNITEEMLTVAIKEVLNNPQRPSKSHHVLGETLFKALVKRGHQVTMVSPFRLEKPVENFEEIVVRDLQNFNEEYDIVKTNIELQSASLFEKIETINKAVNVVHEKFLNDRAVKGLLTSNRTFDLVIQIWTGNSGFLGIAHRFGAPVILLSTVGSTFITNSLTMNSAPYSYVSSILPLQPDEMTFWQRVTNTISYVLLEMYYHLHAQRQQELLRKEYFPEAPSAEELASNISLVLLNSHYSIESPRPSVPSMVQIGGLHAEEPKELKGDLKDFMDSAKDGVVFFSLGSNVKMSDMPKEKLEALLPTFAKVPLKVLWKFDTDNVPNLPPNVKIGKWLPQRDIIAHPNTKLFITHGGLLSTIESVYHGVPMVGIPVFGDQESNVADAVNKGYAVKVAFKDLSEEALTKAIGEVLTNPKYRENVQWRSRVLRDQPLKPLDNAIFWIEYVIRHKGAHHLKTSALKLKWYQYYLLDVLAFLIGIVLVALGTTYLIVSKLIKAILKLFKGKPSLVKDSNKKKTKTA